MATDDSAPDPGAASPAVSYSTAEVARRLGVSTPTVQRWVDHGHLRAWKTIGGHRRIDALSVQRFISSREAPPLQPASQPASQSTSQPSAGPVVDERDADVASLSVLIVDDNPDDRDVLTALVEAALPGARVAQAENGFQGLIRIGQQLPDVLITDVVMPHMDGIEMLRQVSVSACGRPRVIVAVSSRAPPQFAELGPLAGDIGFVGKPIDPAPFLRQLRAWVAAAGD